jgi:hypothetical protein
LDPGRVFPSKQGNLLNQIGILHPNNQSLNIETANSVGDNISLQQVNKSFPHINPKVVEVSPLLSGKKQSPPQISQEIGNLNLRIDYYEQRKQELKALIKEEMRLKNQRRNSVNQERPLEMTNKEGSLGLEKTEGHMSLNKDQSFHKRENADTLSLLEKLGKPEKNQSLLEDLVPKLKEPFTDTFHLKCILIFV